MAVKIILLAFIVGIIMLLIFDTVPANNAFGVCREQISSNYQSMTDYNQKRQRSGERSCQAAYDQIILDLQCITDVDSAYITGRFVFWVSPHRPQINSTIRKHNQYCYTQSIPVYEIDVPGSQN